MQIEIIQLVDADRMARFDPDLATLPPGLLSLIDAAAILGVNPETLRRRIRKGQVDVVRQRPSPGRMGWRWLISTDELRRLKTSGLLEDGRKSIERWEREGE